MIEFYDESFWSITRIWFNNETNEWLNDYDDKFELDFSLLVLFVKKANGANYKRKKLVFLFNLKANICAKHQNKHIKKKNDMK